MSLETFVPEPVTVEIAGETVEIAPLKVGELPAFIRAIRPFAQQLTQDVDWLALFGERGDDLVSALAVAIRRPREWVAARELDEAIRIAEAVFEVNSDFFVRRLAPALARVAVRVEGIGARFSNASSDTGTPSPGVLNYTLGQVWGFLDAIETDERRQLAAHFALQVTAQRGEAAEIKALLRELAP